MPAARISTSLRNEGSVPAETIAVQLLPQDAARRIDVSVAPGRPLLLSQQHQ
jgi:hypothetical protein